jgi:hypothetical protein
MSVDHGERRVFLREILEECNQGDVFEHIGVVACMKAVSVRKHAVIIMDRLLRG